MSATLLQNANLTEYRDGLTIGGNVYFVATDSGRRSELWKTDATAAGTSMVADLGGSYSPPLINVNGTLYFANDGEIFKSDGTAAGTSEIAPARSASDLTPVGNDLYFFGFDLSGNQGLYRTDGTAAGTVEIQTLATDVRPTMANLDGTLYFRDTKLWKADPDGHTELINSFGNPDADEGDMVAFNHHLFYKAADPNNVNQLDLWESDGTLRGPQSSGPAWRGLLRPTIPCKWRAAICFSRQPRTAVVCSSNSIAPMAQPRGRSC